MLFFSPAFCAPVVLAEVAVSAKSAIVMEPVTGQVIFEKEADQRLSMASTTKIMTALLALESGKSSETFEMTKDMVMVEGTSLGLMEGDQITLYDLVCGLMLESGNDAANAAAFAVAGSVEEFALLMNRRAREIGMKDTNFVTPSGLDDEEHYTTARDMALLAAVAIKNDQFREICSSKSLTVQFGNPPRPRKIYNHNRLLRSYEGAIGVKTGFTKKSGRCLVSAAERDGITLVAVTLNAGSDWNDHKAMLDYGFSKTEKITLDTDIDPEIRVKVIGGAKDAVNITASEALDIPMVNGSENSKIKRHVYLSAFEYAPVRKGQTLGEMVFEYEGKIIAGTKILAHSSVNQSLHNYSIWDYWAAVLNKIT